MFIYPPGTYPYWSKFSAVTWGELMEAILNGHKTRAYYLTQRLLHSREFDYMEQGHWSDFPSSKTR